MHYLSYVDFSYFHLSIDEQMLADTIIDFKLYIMCVLFCPSKVNYSLVAERYKEKALFCTC